MGKAPGSSWILGFSFWIFQFSFLIMRYCLHMLHIHTVHVWGKCWILWKCVYEKRMPQRIPTAYDFWYKAFWNSSIFTKQNTQTLDDKLWIKVIIVKFEYYIKPKKSLNFWKGKKIKNSQRDSNSWHTESKKIK